MHEVKFSAIILLTMLALTLTVLYPRRAAQAIGNGGPNRSRWLLFIGTVLMIIQYILQYAYNLRDISPSHAAFVNLTLLIPASWMNSWAIVQLQRPKHAWRGLGIPGALAFGISLLVMGLALVRCKGNSLDTPCMHYAEYISGAAYGLMQAYYIILYLVDNKRFHRVLDNYFDHETRVVQRWLEISVGLLGVLNVLTPLVFFTKSELLLIIYTLAALLFMYYLVVSFTTYSMSQGPHLVKQAQLNATLAKLDPMSSPGSPAPVLSEEELGEVKAIVDKWVSEGGYLRSGINMQTVAEEMNLPRELLTAWLKTTEWELFAPWLSSLRLEKAKQMLVMHPEWSNDAIAQFCGFNSRVYFQQAFKKKTGKTPAQFANKDGAELQ